MKISVDIQQVRCARTTWELGKDEVYLVCAGIGEKKDARDVYAAMPFFKVSEIWKKISAGDKWKPEKSKFVIDLGEAEVGTVIFALFEADNREAYQKMLNGTTLIAPENFDWRKLKDIGSTLLQDVTNYKTWIKSVVKTFMITYDYFVQDDLIGMHCVHAAINDTAWIGFRELEFTGWFAKYNLNLNIIAEN